MLRSENDVIRKPRFTGCRFEINIYPILETLIIYNRDMAQLGPYLDLMVSRYSPKLRSHLDCVIII